MARGVAATAPAISVVPVPVDDIRAGVQLACFQPCVYSQWDGHLARACLLLLLLA